MSLDLPTGLASRPATPADAKALFDLIVACEMADDGDYEIDEHDITVMFERHGFDPELDTVLILDRDRPVGWATLYRGRSEGDVRSSHRGRGIGSALLSWIEARGRALGEPAVGQTKSDANVAARELFLANGYEPSWTSWMIRIEVSEPPLPPTTPPGVSIRRYGDADARQVHSVMDAAFSEWEGRNPEPFEVWASGVLAHPAFAPEISPLAFDGEEPVGAVLSFDYPAYNEGWVMQLATKATHRRRGIAQALLGTAFGWFFERGRRSVGVATDSRTGALALYEKVGMRIVRQYTRYTKRLGP